MAEIQILIKHSHVFCRYNKDSNNECIYLYITDNGQGFNIEQSKTTLGLIGLRERAVSLGGELEIESQIGKGTTISAIVPKKQHHENFNRG